MSIFEVEHQPRAHRFIQRALGCERMPHAYLFAGPEGVGKEMLAARLARTLLCESPVRRPLEGDLARDIGSSEGLDACGTCVDCQLAAAGTHPDVFLIHRQLNKQHPDTTIRKQKALVLGVEVIRYFLIDRAGRSASRGRAKVFIVREAERMNEAAQNALLKTLEEPLGTTFIILLTHALDSMLPTTRSRCQQVLFQPLPADFVAGRLRGLCPDADEREIVYAASHAGGSLGTALRYVEDGLYALKCKWGERLAAMLGAPGKWRGGAEADMPHLLAKPFVEDAKTLGKFVVARDRDVSETDATRAGLRALFSVLADFHVDAIRQVTGADLPPVNADQPVVVETLARGHTERSLLRSLQWFAEAETHIARNAHVELALETLFIRLAQAVPATTAAR